MMKICGAVVLYNPTEDVLTNINSYCDCLEKLFIIDNSDNINPYIIEKLMCKENIEYISMNGNKGIAEALKLSLKRAIEGNFDFCLTMDQDSFYKEKISDYYDILYKNSDIYRIIGSNINKNIDNSNNIIEDKFLLTSGNFVNVKNYLKIKGFSEELFIDYVDFDLCQQFYEKGYKVGYISSLILEHKIGNPINKNIFGLKFTCMNHNPIRYYYRFRNNFFLYKKHKKYYFKKYWHDILIDIPKVILFENRKIEKLKMIVKGRKDAKKGILGKYKED